MAELKPCPFCGGTQLFVGTIAECEMQDETHPDYQSNSQLYTVCCNYQELGCGASIGGDCYSEQEAIEAWNRRVPQTQVHQYGENCTHISNCGTLNLSL